VTIKKFLNLVDMAELWLVIDLTTQTFRHHDIFDEAQFWALVESNGSFSLTFNLTQKKFENCPLSLTIYHDFNEHQMVFNSSIIGTANGRWKIWNIMLSNNLSTYLCERDSHHRLPCYHINIKLIFLQLKSSIENSLKTLISQCLIPLIFQYSIPIYLIPHCSILQAFQVAGLDVYTSEERAIRQHNFTTQIGALPECWDFCWTTTAMMTLAKSSTKNRDGTLEP
jgi:hypothetical protein